MSKVNEKEPREACKASPWFRSHYNLLLLLSTSLREKALQWNRTRKLSVSTSGNWEWSG